MDRFISSSKYIFALLLTGFLLILLPVKHLYATAGCCSNHGGVAQCDSKTKHLVCKDNTQSATCLCDGSKAAVAVPVTKVKNTTTRHPKANSNKPLPKSTNAVETTPESKVVKQKVKKVKSKTTKIKEPKVNKSNPKPKTTEANKSPKATTEVKATKPKTPKSKKIESNDNNI